MAMNGYGLTFAGSSLGSIASTLIKSITVAGMTLRTERVRTVGDTYRAGTAYPLDVTEGKMTLVLVYNKTVYSALNTACRGRTKDTFTATDADGTTFVGAGYIESPGDVPLDTEKHAEHTVTLEPETVWIRTPGV